MGNETSVEVVPAVCCIGYDALRFRESICAVGESVVYSWAWLVPYVGLMYVGRHTTVRNGRTAYDFVNGWKEIHDTDRKDGSE